VINKVAKSYNVKFIAGAKMHQLKHYIINGNKTVVTREVSANNCIFLSLLITVC
jgi:hypothetical protein